MEEAVFDPNEVVKIVDEALASHSILPLSFIETTLFEKLYSLLSAYMNQADIAYIISELKAYFFEGFTKFTPQKLQDVIQHCRKCSAVPHPPIMPSWNFNDPDLMIVAENPTSTAPHMVSLVKALKEAGFSSDRCTLTYVSRCSINQPTPEIVASCLPYLHTEIAVLNPKLILTLGLSPYISLTGDDKTKLKSILGSIFWWGPYAILPEVSLAWSDRMLKTNSSFRPSLVSSLHTAKTFLYGGTHTL